MKFVLVVVSAIAVFTADSRVYPENPDKGPNPVYVVIPSPDHGTADGFDDDLDEQSFTDEADNFSVNADDAQEAEILNGEHRDLVTSQEYQQFMKERKGLNAPELRGKKQNNILKQIIKDLEYIKYNLTHTETYLKEELKSMRENQKNITNIGKEFKIELQSMGKDLRGDLQSIIGNITNGNSVLTNIDNRTSIIISKLNKRNNSCQGPSTSPPLMTTLPATTVPSGPSTSPPLMTTLPATTVPSVLVCNGTQLEFAIGRQCFIMYKTTKKDWSSARSYCQGIGLDLAQPEHPSLVKIYIRQNLYNGASTDTWIGAVGTGSCYQWLNGTCISHTSPLWWGSSGPQYDNSSRYAITLREGTAYDYTPLDVDAKSDTHYTLCERK